MTDFLLELRSEEIPARMQAGARAELEKLFRAQMATAGVVVGEVTVWSTPRRLALIARGLPLTAALVIEEIKGPRASAPAQAIDGFLRKHRLSFSELVERDGVLYAITEQKTARATNAVLAKAIPAIIRSFSWPKSMRWGAASKTTTSLRWVRPLSGIVALFGDDLVPCDIDGIASGYATRGHRFHCPGEITIGSASDYAEKLRACHVIVDQDERATIIRDGAAKAAADAGLVLVADEGLVIENAGLTEWPVPLLGRFDEAFLAVPPEVIQLTARVNQKYFVCEYPPRNGEGDHAQHGGGAPSVLDKADGKLANAFVCTANIAASDGGAAIIAGNEKVLAARLSDARFFWDQDRKTTLEDHAKKLERITFHEKLGTVADKVARVAKLARWLVEEGIVHTSSPAKAGAQGGIEPASASGSLRPRLSPGNSEISTVELATLAEQAARLCKADLVTEMVGEFPELQGLMGGYYAAAEGLDPQVAAAIRDHYKPVGQGDDVPTAPVTVAVALADKLDTLVAFFGLKEFPSGSKDPFALRRAALGVIRILELNQTRIPLSRLNAFALQPIVKWAVGGAMKELSDADAKALVRTGNNPISVTDPRYVEDFLKLPSVKSFVDGFAALDDTLIPFFADRLKVQQREAGVRHDLIDAVFALGGEDDLVRLLARVKALQAFVATPDGVNLLAGYKRAANILKQAGQTSPLPFRGGAGGGVSRNSAAQTDRPHPNPSPKGEGLEETDAALLTALDTAEPAATTAVAEERFTDAMTALASLRSPIDAFFDGVMVNDPDPAVRAFRLGLLARFRDAVHAVADFSKIEG